jgi:phosphohistidine swiveling domain-containing protein
MTLPLLPPTPAGVRYALTVPQSVLFADISLRGSRRAAFREVFGGDFELDYVVIDDGAMSWDFSGDGGFARALLGSGDATVAVRRFVAGMGATARAVDKTSWMLSSDATRRAGDVDDLLADLRDYWGAYERHMTSLFTFWNVEEVLSEALTEMLRENDLEGEIEAGLERFLQPSETNYFALERRGLERIASRFGTGATDEEALQEALTRHVGDFGFLLAPFNLGKPPSVASLAERLQADVLAGTEAGALVDGRPEMLADLPEPIRELGLLAQELTFWKTERLDVMSLADSRAAGLYSAAADALSIDSDHLFAMRREEIDRSLKDGKPAVPADVLDRRLAGYCLLLLHGEIAFHEPTRKPAEPAADAVELGSGELRGTAASRGVATGPVRRIMDLADAPSLQAGDILVTTMTRPEMGVALDRAAAFVTDQGGRMSHAAIIAREMHKPCVIGTGEATQVLRDGMMVTVDGEHGVVTIQDRSET